MGAEGLGAHHGEAENVSRRPAGALLDPRHVRELAAMLPSARPGRPVVVATSLGIRVSAGDIDGIRHYTLTRTEPPLRSDQAAELARLVAWLGGAGPPEQVLTGVGGAYHLVSSGVGQRAS
jgi:hypothetical protein